MEAYALTKDGVCRAFTVETLRAWLDGLDVEGDTIVMIPDESKGNWIPVFGAELGSSECEEGHKEPCVFLGRS